MSPNVDMPSTVPNADEPSAVPNETVVPPAAPPSYSELSAMLSARSEDERPVPFNNVEMRDLRDRPPTYSESESRSLSYADLGAILDGMKSDTGAYASLSLCCLHNVKTYLIMKNGAVTISNVPDTLRIFEIEGGEVSLPKYYLQIHTYVYPLVPKVSPCMKTEFAAFLFPNINVDDESGIETFGVVVEKLEDEELLTTLLENILQVKIDFCNIQKAQKDVTRIAQYITNGANFVSRTLVGGAQRTGRFLDGNASRVVGTTEPSDDRRTVRPCVRNGVRIAKNVTSVTATATGFIASKVSSATFALGRFIAPHVKRVVATGIGEEKTEAVFEVAGSAVGGLGTVFLGLGQSAVILGRSISNNTVQVVTHKYGKDAGSVVDDTFQTVGNGIQIGTSVQVFRPASLAQGTVMGTVAPTDNDEERAARSERMKKFWKEKRKLKKHQN